MTLPILWVIVPSSQKETLFLKCLETLSPRLNRLSGTLEVLFGKVCFGSSFSNTYLIFRPNMASAGDRASGMLGFAMIL